MLNNYLSMNREQLDENTPNAVENEIFTILTNTIKSELGEISTYLINLRHT